MFLLAESWDCSDSFALFAMRPPNFSGDLSSSCSTLQKPRLGTTRTFRP